MSRERWTQSWLGRTGQVSTLPGQFIVAMAQAVVELPRLEERLAIAGWLAAALRPDTILLAHPNTCQFLTDVVEWSLRATSDVKRAPRSNAASVLRIPGEQIGLRINIARTCTISPWYACDALPAVEHSSTEDQPSKGTHLVILDASDYPMLPAWTWSVRTLADVACTVTIVTDDATRLSMVPHVRPTADNGDLSECCEGPVSREFWSPRLGRTDMQLESIMAVLNRQLALRRRGVPAAIDSTLDWVEERYRWAREPRQTPELGPGRSPIAHICEALSKSVFDRGR